MNAAIVMMLSAALLVELGCVTRVQVCTTYDRRIGRERPGEYARDGAGASVCADVERAPE